MIEDAIKSHIVDPDAWEELAASVTSDRETIAEALSKLG